MYRVTILDGKNLLLTCIWDVLLGQWAATEAAHQLPEVLELSQQEVFSDQNGHPVLPAW